MLISLFDQFLQVFYTAYRKLTFHFDILLPMGELEKGGAEGLGAASLVSARGHDHHGFVVGNGMMFLRRVHV
jgi:hypothetical protein